MNVKLDRIDLIDFYFFRSCPPVAVVLARRRMAGERVETCDQLEFDVVEVADTMGWQLPLVKRGLRQLQWSTDRGIFMHEQKLFKNRKVGGAQCP